jgi:acyl-CoA dehydrogenase
MDFTPDPELAETLETASKFVHETVIPAEQRYREELARLPDPSVPGYWRRPPVVFELMDQARDQGLFNLFLRAPWGRGLTNLQYAPFAELTGWSPNLAPAAMNSAAPDSGNMELLADFATEEQQERWLRPLTEGRTRSSFCMTEPDVASSDARNVQTRIEINAENAVINGRKWYISGALNPEAEIFIVMGKNDPSAEPHRQQSMVLVPRDTPGVTVVRPMHVFGFDDREHGGHAEVLFENVSVPREHVLKGPGEGFSIAQARLGPGRIHHCMRLIGMGERALRLAADRAWDRAPFGKPLAERDVVRHMVANARIALDQARLLVLHTAWFMDQYGNKAAHERIQAIKIAVPRTVQQILDDVIQLHGAAGLSQDSPLAELFAAARGLRLADGPDETHLTALGRNLLKAHRPA